MKMEHKKQTERLSNRKWLIIDGILVVVFVSIGITVAIFFDLYELFYNLTRSREASEVDDWLMFLPLFLALALLWYSVRRTLETRRALQDAHTYAAELSSGQ